MKTLQAARAACAVLAAISQGSLAEGIDLDCETLSKQMVDRLDAEGLLTRSGTGRERALAVTRELCGGAEASAQRQHENGVQQAMENWFLEKQPEKPGNRRLKNLKR